MKLSVFAIILLALFSACSDNKAVKKSTEPNTFYYQAYHYDDHGLQDSAFLFFSKAKDVFSQRGDSLGIGKCLLNMAIISNSRGDYFGAQELSLSAIPFFRPHNLKEHPYLQSNYNNLGMVSYNLLDFRQAITFYNIAKKYTLDAAGLLILNNNIANAYRRLGEFDKAIKIYSIILSQKLSEKEWSRTLSNFAYTKWQQNRKYDASNELFRALKVRKHIADLQGQISSYTFLTDFYSLTQPGLAKYYAKEMYNVAEKINNPNDKLEALQRLVRLSAENQSKQYFNVHQILNDSLQTARNAAKNQFALIRYESEKSKADNLRLQQENTEKTYQVNKQKTVTYLLSFLFVLFTLIGLYLSKKRKERLELTAQNRIKEGQLKTSKKVHDVVANGLYRVMTEIENQSGIGKEEILDRLDGMYQKSRDISYEVELPQAQDYHKK
ncbi:tetratricopeptide repeat protein [Pedobacter agri]|nr:tetratricopeptide repeat protein [Pedobacter agri]